MKPINILILDDNFVIADKVKRRLFSADKSYKYESGIEIFPHYIRIDNTDAKIAANTVNNYIKENDIKYLLLDRGFGEIIDPNETNNNELNSEYVYKNNDKSGFYIENLLSELKAIKKNGLSKIKGAVIYTYDDYREQNKQGDTIKEEIIHEMKSILPKKCRIDVLLAYSDIYKIAEIDLYEGYAEPGIIKLGKRNEFVLYGIFVGELLYHKIVQMVNINKMDFIKERKTAIFLRLFILYLIFISLSIGGNAIYNYLFSENSLMIGVVSLIFGLMIPLIILFLKPSILIDIEE